MNDTRFYHLMSDIQLVNKWLDTGNATYSHNVDMAIVEYQKCLGELKQFSQKPKHSVFNMGDINLMVKTLEATITRLSSLVAA